MMSTSFHTRARESTTAPIVDGLLLPDDDRPFRLGDPVVYRAHGVGFVSRIGKHLVAGERIDMIQIAFRTNAMTLLIPTLTASRAGLRHVSSQAIVDEAILSITRPARPPRGPWPKKRDMIERKINSGELSQLADVVRDLRRPHDKKNQSFSETRLFEAALARFVSELAVTTGRTEEEILAHVHAVLATADTTPAETEPGSAPD